MKTLNKSLLEFWHDELPRWMHFVRHTVYYVRFVRTQSMIRVTIVTPNPTTRLQELMSIYGCNVFPTRSSLAQMLVLAGGTILSAVPFHRRCDSALGFLLG